MVTAPVNRILPFSSVDGPGSRTAVFLQGCNLDCRYCHNPETRSMCRHCGQCVRHCKKGALVMQDGRVRYIYGRCVFCDACIQSCPYGSSPRIRWMSASEVFCEIQRQMPLIRGVTVSGGECTLYPEFLTELFSLCKGAGLHTLLDSNGTADFSRLPELLSVTDGVMLDIKAFDREEHVRVTGAENGEILENAVFLAGAGKLEEVRTVVVPGLFDAEATVREVCRLLTECGAANVRYRLIAYREAGVRKEYRRYCPPEKAQMDELAALAAECGAGCVTVV